jgi:hypothetical protein
MNNEEKHEDVQSEEMEEEEELINSENNASEISLALFSEIINSSSSSISLILKIMQVKFPNLMKWMKMMS